PDVEVTAIAARDRGRAEQHARELGIPYVHDSYVDLLASSEVDAVYVPLPNSLHGPWSIRALEAGKHVLCEKPVTSNEKQARAVADVAARTGLVVCEAMHSVYHGLYDRTAEILAAGTIGDVEHVSVRVHMPIPNRNNIRWKYELGGGAMMDLGVYAVTVLRTLAGMEVAAVLSATGRTRTPLVDRCVTAEVCFPNGATGSVSVSMWGWPPLAVGASVR
ncbi:Gfo/Idh/MocA family protein, partial [Kibdelosporangium lantanae]